MINLYLNGEEDDTFGVILRSRAGARGTFVKIRMGCAECQAYGGVLLQHVFAFYFLGRCECYCSACNPILFPSESCMIAI